MILLPLPYPPPTNSSMTKAPSHRWSSTRQTDIPQPPTQRKGQPRPARETAMGQWHGLPLSSLSFLEGTSRAPSVAHADWESPTRLTHASLDGKISVITPTSTPNSRLYSRTYLVFVLAKCQGCAMPLSFHWVFESQRRRHARLVSIDDVIRRWRPDYIMTMARSRPDHNLCVAMHGKSLGVSEVRGQMASGDQIMGQIMLTGKSLGSNHVDTEVARVTSCGHGSRWGSAGIKSC